MKTNYSLHDEVYRKLKKEEGILGWDKTQAAYEEMERRLKSLFDLGKMPPCGRLLELGCGAGNVSLRLEKQGYEVTGIDISPTAIEWAKSKCLDASGTTKFYVDNVLAMRSVGKGRSVEEGYFDIVLDGHCLHCIVGDDRRAFLSESLRVLKPGGWLLIDTMCGPVTGNKLSGYDPPTKCTIRDGIATRYLGLPEEIEKEVIDAGFVIKLVIREPEATHSTVTIVAVKPSLSDI